MEYFPNITAVAKNERQTATRGNRIITVYNKKYLNWRKLVNVQLVLLFTATYFCELSVEIL